MRHPLREVSEEGTQVGKGEADKTVPAAAAAAARVQLNTINLSVTHGAKTQVGGASSWGTKTGCTFDGKKKEEISMRSLAASTLCPFLSTARHRNRHI